MKRYRNVSRNASSNDPRTIISYNVNKRNKDIQSLFFSFKIIRRCWIMSIAIRLGFGFRVLRFLHLAKREVHKPDPKSWRVPSGNGDWIEGEREKARVDSTLLNGPGF